MVVELPQVVSWEVVAKTQWLRLLRIKYLDREGRQRTWEAAARALRPLPPPGSWPVFEADAVGIIAILRSKHMEPSLLLVRQFRPPLGCDTLELPAGLIDAGESPAQAAVRELQEETGYTVNEATVQATEPLCLSPGLSNECFHLVRVDIHLDAPENSFPKQADHDVRRIQVVRIPLSQLGEALQNFAAPRYEGQGGRVFGALHTMLTGITLGREMAEQECSQLLLSNDKNECRAAAHGFGAGMVTGVLAAGAMMLALRRASAMTSSL